MVEQKCFYTQDYKKRHSIISSELYKDNPEYACNPEKKSWNPGGTDMKFVSWDVPIFLLQNETEIGYIENEVGTKQASFIVPVIHKTVV